MHFFFSVVLLSNVSRSFGTKKREVGSRYASFFILQMDPENKPTRDELKEEVLKVSKGLVGLGGFNLVSVRACACLKGYSHYENASITEL